MPCMMTLAQNTMNCKVIKIVCLVGMAPFSLKNLLVENVRDILDIIFLIEKDPQDQSSSLRLYLVVLWV